jgi:glycosyltransferase involved in cell wall biosynthesis
MNEYNTISTFNTLVSYCIPSYNHAKFLPKLLDIIIDEATQLGFSYEIVILDDGSSDETRSVLKPYYKIKNLKVLYFENVGVSKNLNRIKQYTNGAWIRLIASDDLIIKGSTRKMLDAVKADTLCLVADGVVINEFDDIICQSLIEYHGGSKRKLRNKKTLPYEFISNYSLAGPCLLINRQVYDFYKYDEKSLIDDFDFFISLLMYNDNCVDYIDENVCKYRIHGSNSSKTIDIDRRILNQKSMLMLVNKFLKLNKFRYPLLKKKAIITLKIVFLKFIKHFKV